MKTLQDIDAIIAKQWPLFTEDLAKLIAIPSTRGPSQSHAPFGEQPRRALEQIVAIAKSYGFQTGIVNDAMAYVQWGEDSSNYLGVVGHLDVVSAGSGWTSDPFTLMQRNGRLYGRGVLDNKGPSLACLYALKILHETHLRPQKTVRLIFGSDEESGSQDIKMYLQQQPAPVFGFTPDCKYPAVYGERGIVNYAITTTIDDGSLKQLSSLEGEQALDHVPDDIKVLVNGQPLHISGRRTPTNAPELGENALTLLAEKICQQHLVQGELASYFSWLANSFHEQHYGEGLGINFADAASGKLIVAPYLLQKTKTNLRLEIAIRYPVSYQEEEVTAGLKKALLPHSQLQIIRSLKSVRHDPHDPNVIALSQAYQEVTGLDATPVTTTGATYARFMPNIIAFGPSFPGQKGIAHKQDEWMSIQDLQLNIKIYLQAILKLCKRKE